ncbi:hypothetical protein MRX96_056158 [Rhipicephalus microplus]
MARQVLDWLSSIAATPNAIDEPGAGRETTAAGKSRSVLRRRAAERTVERPSGTRGVGRSASFAATLKSPLWRSFRGARVFFPVEHFRVFSGIPFPVPCEGPELGLTIVLKLC